jgi:hypothetical protein
MPDTYEPIASFTFTGGEVSTTFSSIPQTYTDLRVVLVGTSAGGGNSMVRVNGSSTGYTGVKLFGSNATVGVSTQSSSGSGFITTSGSAQGFDSTTTNAYVCDIFNYTNSNRYKTALHSGFEGATSTNMYVLLWSGTWENANAITSVSAGNLSNTMDAGSVATLYGIKAA